jgi:alpha-tubulin suppressor-like RCC1 family protein
MAETNTKGVLTAGEVYERQVAAVWPTTWYVAPPVLYVWGNNSYGKLGFGNTVNIAIPADLSDTTNVAVIYAATNNSAIVKSNGTLWIWGNNTEGTLGQGDTIHRSSPMQVGALTNWKTSGTAVAISDSNCYAVKADGTLWSWGGRSFGSIGDGTTIAKSSPVQIGALTTWSSVAAANNVGAAIQTNGTLWMWGYNYYGRLGNGTTVHRSSPTQVGALTNWASVAVSPFAATLAVKTDGTLWAWGRNYYGQHGLGNTINRSSPIQVGALTNWSKVDLYIGVVATKIDGTLWEWGGFAPATSSPVQIGALTNWSIPTKAGYATKTDGTLWTWSTSSAQVGSLTTWSLLTSSNNHFLGKANGP